MRLPFLDADAVAEHLPMEAAIDAIEASLLAGLDPEADPARGVVDVPAGQLLLMPAAGAGRVGVKVASVTPGNRGRGLPRIQGVYLLLDGGTLAPVAVLDGLLLTAVRTPAVSAVAVRHLADPNAERLVVFGSGPQAWGHVAALRLVRPVGDVRVVARDPGRLAEFVRRCRAAGLSATAGRPEDVRTADIVACCTTSTGPLFDGATLPGHACVVAIGSHEPTVREVDALTVRRSTVVVEARSAAWREAGDLIIARESGVVGESVVEGNLADLVLGRITVPPRRPRLFKSVGMAWEDLVLAAAAYDHAEGGR